MTSKEIEIGSRVLLADQIAELKEGRGQAIACAALSLAISVALLLSNFPGDRKLIENATRAVAEHRAMLKRAEENLRVNEQVLKQNQEYLANVRRVTGR